MQLLVKLIGTALVIYSVVAGLIIDVPQLPVVRESIRNLFYHVPMWFTMIFLLAISLYNSIKYLIASKKNYDVASDEAVKTALFFGLLGIVTGSIWAKFTWGAWWVNDPKLNGAALTILTYLAAQVLRTSINDSDKRARISAVYNIIAFVFMILFILVLPRLSFGSLHPGTDGNPVLGGEQLKANMRLVFYPAIVGWLIIGWWIWKMKLKILSIK